MNEKFPSSRPSGSPADQTSIEKGTVHDFTARPAPHAYEPTHFHPGPPGATPAAVSLPTAGDIDDDLVGTSLDIYQIIEPLGAGAMGRVYLAWHDRLHRLIALKVLTAEVVRDDPRRLELFMTEARSAARIVHPGVVTVHSIGSDRGYHFIETEYVEGKALGAILAEQKKLSPREAIAVFDPVVSGLAEAHALGIIHCDIKPDNVLVGRGGRAKLADFGLARMLHHEPTRSRFGRVGTPRYMAPEIHAGAGPSHATDVFALGTSLYVAVAGQHPFPGASLSELAQYWMQESIPDVREHAPHVPEDVANLIREMMTKDPARRPPCDAELVRRFATLLTSLTPFDDIVAAAIAGLEIRWTKKDEAHEFQVPLPQGRKQIVTAHIHRSADGDEETITFETPCAPADESHYPYVLELNGRVAFGSIGLRTWHGKPYFVMVHNLRRDSADPEEVRSALLNVARYADVVERLITGSDEF